jgi:hypothetical protein
MFGVGWDNLEERLPTTMDGLGSVSGSVHTHWIRLLKIMAKPATFVYGGQTTGPLAEKISRHGRYRESRWQWQIGDGHFGTWNRPGALDERRVAALYSNASCALYELAESFLLAAMGLFRSNLFLKLSERIRLSVVASRPERFGRHLDIGSFLESSRNFEIQVLLDSK